jgi:hypothetical protein
MRFITTHGFLRPLALKAACFLEYSVAALFGGLLVFKFGNDSVTAASFRAPGARRVDIVGKAESSRRSHSAPAFVPVYAAWPLPAANSGGAFSAHPEDRENLSRGCSDWI